MPKWRGLVLLTEVMLVWVTGTGSLSDQDCKYGLKEEINGCGWGGENTHGSFYYRYVWVLHSIYKGCW